MMRSEARGELLGVWSDGVYSPWYVSDSGGSPVMKEYQGFSGGHRVWNTKRLDDGRA